jgi:hypothetical protein
MKFACGAFNIILVALIALTTGCLTDGMPKAKEASTFKLFVETGRQLAERSQEVTVLTDPPLKLNVETEPFIEESDITGAKLIEADGRFAVQVTFSHHGSLVLETTSYAQRGKFIAIFSQFPEPRWIGALPIRAPIKNGEIIFRMNDTRERCERLVSGLNKVAAAMKKAGQY